MHFTSIYNAATFSLYHRWLLTKTVYSIYLYHRKEELSEGTSKNIELTQFRETGIKTWILESTSMNPLRQHLVEPRGGGGVLNFQFGIDVRPRKAAKGGLKNG